MREGLEFLEKEMSESKVALGEYRGKQLVIVRDGETDRFPFRFGPVKARKLLAAYEQDQTLFWKIVQKVAEEE